jgi:hypothetical protein
MTLPGFLIGLLVYLLASLGLVLLMGRWLHSSSAQDDADAEQLNNMLRYYLLQHPEVLRGR